MFSTLLIFSGILSHLEMIYTLNNEEYYIYFLFLILILFKTFYTLNMELRVKVCVLDVMCSFVSKVVNPGRKFQKHLVKTSHKK